MGLRINSNQPALFARRQTEEATGLLGKALQQLASGRRINRAADDAAGLAIAERFNSQIRQGQQEINNLQSGISAVQTAEGGLESQQDAAQRLRELAVQASNGTLSDDQRAALNAEAQELIEQIGETAENTEFNGTKLLNANQTVPLGTAGGTSVTLNESTVSSLGLGSVNLNTQGGAQSAVNQIDQALNRISNNRASLGAQANRFESAISNRGVNVQNAQESESRIRDLDIAIGFLNRARGELKQRSGIAGLLQSNVTPQSALRLLGG